MSIRLLTFILIILIMLKRTLNHIQTLEPDGNRRQTFIKIITNAEKLAKARERANFLVNCRKNDVIPKFLSRKTRTLEDIFPHNKQVVQIQSKFLKKLLNEAIKTTFRTIAFLEREKQRLDMVRRLENHPLSTVVVQYASEVYFDAVVKNKNTLKKKLVDLRTQQERFMAKNQNNTCTNDTTKHDNGYNSPSWMPEKASSGRTMNEIDDDHDTTSSLSHDVATIHPQEASKRQLSRTTPGVIPSTDIPNADSSEESAFGGEQGQRECRHSTTGCNAGASTSEYRHHRVETGPSSENSMCSSQEVSTMTCYTDRSVLSSTPIDEFLDALLCCKGEEGCCPCRDATLLEDDAIVSGHSDHTVACLDRSDGSHSEAEWFDTTLSARSAKCSLHSQPVSTSDLTCVLTTNVTDDTEGDSAPSESKRRASVTNLTERTLPDTLMNMLSKGPNFALSRRICKQVLQSVENGIERGAFALRWKIFISSKRHTEQNQVPPQQSQQQQQQHTVRDNPDNSDLTQNAAQDSNERIKPLNITPRFSDTDTRMAPPADTTIERSLRSLKHKIMNCFKNHRNTSDMNYSKEELKALNEISADPNIIVKRSDKCKGFVVMSRDTYVEKAESITSQYEQVSKNPTPRLEAATKKIISSSLGGKLPDKIVNAIKPTSSRTAELYGLPKNHKPDIPLRPIVSACGDPLDKLTWLLERIISQLLKFVPAHLKNTYDFLERLKSEFPNGLPKHTIIFTVDVANLYGNIPIQEAIQSTLTLIAKHQDKIDLLGLDLDTIGSLLSHCLTNNYVKFGQKIYKQTHGIAMGSRMASPLAIIFMNAVESMMLSSAERQPILYVRYIDDIFGIWTHGPAALDEFLSHLNSFHPSLKFSAERSDNSSVRCVPFLDTSITLKDDGSFTTELFIKPMASPIILPFTSAHPMQTKKSVLYAQLLRANRLGSSHAARERGMHKIEQLFLENGYPAKMIKRTKFSVMTRNTKQKDERLSQKRPDKHTHTTTISPRGHPDGPSNSSDITYISLPYIDDALSRKVDSMVKTSGLSVRVAWQSGKTLAGKLTRSALEKVPCPAGNKKCNCCLSGLEGRCHTKNTVYMVTCNLCSNTPAYIGETKRCVRLRFNEHIRDARNKSKNTPLGEHFTQCHPLSHIDHKTFTISILQTCKDMAELKIAESIEIRNRRPLLNIMTSSWTLIKPKSYADF